MKLNTGMALLNLAFVQSSTPGLEAVKWHGMAEERKPNRGCSPVMLFSVTDKA